MTRRKRKNWLTPRNFWEILMVQVQRHIKVKYKQTFFGFVWALFLPVVVVAAGVLVRAGIWFLSSGTVELTRISSVAVKSLPWAFFTGGLRFTVNSLVANMAMLKKIYFPRIIFPLSYILSSLFDLVVASVVFAVVLAFTGIGASVYLLWVPFLVMLLVAFTGGLGILLSCFNLFYRDVKLIIDVILTFAIFITPVYYDVDIFGPKWETLLMMNPIAPILEGLNYTIVYHKSPDLFWLGYSIIVTFAVCTLGWKIFHKIEPTFADRV